MRLGVRVRVYGRALPLALPRRERSRPAAAAPSSRGLPRASRRAPFPCPRPQPDHPLPPYTARCRLVPRPGRARRESHVRRVAAEVRRRQRRRRRLTNSPKGRRSWSSRTAAEPPRQAAAPHPRSCCRIRRQRRLLRIWRAEEVEWRCAAAVVATTSTLLLLLRLLLLRLLHLRRSSPSRAPVGGVDASPSSAAPREALPCEHRRRVVDGFAVGAKKGLVLRVGPTHAHARTHMQHARVVAAVAVVRRREREGEINFSSFAIFFSLLTAQ